MCSYLIIFIYVEEQWKVEVSHVIKAVKIDYTKRKKFWAIFVFILYLNNY